MRSSRKFLRLSLCFGKRAACAIPHPQKAHRGGEDAFFSHPNGIGVADGVGGYARENVNPALYTRNVMRYCLEAVSSCSTKGGISSLDALNYGAMMADRQGDIGGCPATLATLQNENCASILNLGDCGTIVVRGKTVLFESKQQQHSFNCPFQLPTDAPARGQQATINVMEDDLFLCVSDGVLDNLELDDILSYLREVKTNGCAKVATRIGEHAALNAQNKTVMSPFAKHALSAGFRYQGGKVDDITVMLAVVSVSDLVEDECSCPSLITDIFPPE